MECDLFRRGAGLFKGGRPSSWLLAQYPANNTDYSSLHRQLVEYRRAIFFFVTFKVGQNAIVLKNQNLNY